MLWGEIGVLVLHLLLPNWRGLSAVLLFVPDELLGYRGEIVCFHANFDGHRARRARLVWRLQRLDQSLLVEHGLGSILLLLLLRCKLLPLSRPRWLAMHLSHDIEVHEIGANDCRVVLRTRVRSLGRTLLIVDVSHLVFGKSKRILLRRGCQNLSILLKGGLVRSSIP